MCRGFGWCGRGVCCCIALVKKEKVDRFILYVAQKYEQKTMLKADFYVCDLVDGVRKLDN